MPAKYSKLYFLIMGLFLFIHVQSLANATTFIPVSIRKMLKESYGVMRGIYLGKMYKKMPNGEIVTVASFRPLESAGIKQSEMINRNEFKVMWPGGVWEGVVYSVQGTPQFIEGEEAVVLINKSSSGFWVHNLGMGKFNIVNKEGRTKLVSSIFPEHPTYGQIGIEDFRGLVQEEVGQELRPVEARRLVVENSVQEKRYWSKRNVGNVKENYRSISSVESENEEDPESGSFSLIWLALVLTCLGLFSVLVTRKRG